MKKMIFSLVGLASLMFAGCKTTPPSTNTVHSLALAVGYAAGYACELSKMDQATKETIVSIVDVVEQVVPEDGQTYEAAWTPLAASIVSDLVEQKKLTETQATLVRLSFGTLVTGVDYMFTVHKSWKDYADLVNAAISGICTGYKSVLKPALSVGKSASEWYVSKMDKQAYSYLKMKQGFGAKSR